MANSFHYRDRRFCSPSYMTVTSIYWPIISFAKIAGVCWNNRVHSHTLYGVPMGQYACNAQWKENPQGFSW
jgi:hypothetical protein